MKRTQLWVLVAVLLVGPCTAFAQQPAQKGGLSLPTLTEAQKKSMQQMNSGRPGSPQPNTALRDQQMRMWQQRQQAEKARQQQLQNARTVAKPGSQPAQKNQARPNQYQRTLDVLGR